MLYVYIIDILQAKMVNKLQTVPVWDDACRKKEANTMCESILLNRLRTRVTEGSTFRWYTESSFMKIPCTTGTCNPVCRKLSVPF